MELISEVFTSILAASGTALTGFGIAQLLFIAVNVLILLATFYLRPIRTKKQFFKLMGYLFAAAAICCMTWWWFFSATEGTP